MSLRALEWEYLSLDRALDDPGDDGAYASVSDRQHDIFQAINTTPPADLRDCLIKLKRLSDLSHGMAEGKIKGDAECLRQVVAFLERFL